MFCDYTGLILWFTNFSNGSTTFAYTACVNFSFDELVCYVSHECGVRSNCGGMVNGTVVALTAGTAAFAAGAAVVTAARMVENTIEGLLGKEPPGLGLGRRQSLFSGALRLVPPARSARTRAAIASADSPNWARCAAWLACWTKTFGTPTRSTGIMIPRSYELDYRRTEAAGEAVLFERDETAVRFGQFEDQLFIERVDEAGVDDGRLEAPPPLEQRVRVERGVDRVAQREDRDVGPAAQHLGTAEHSGAIGSSCAPLVEPRG